MVRERNLDGDLDWQKRTWPRLLYSRILPRLASSKATGDVVRTTPLLRDIEGEICWLTEARNTVLLSNISDQLQRFSWEEPESVPDTPYDLRYTDDSRRWFD